jgi:hypothetical protein
MVLLKKLIDLFLLSRPPDQAEGERLLVGPGPCMGPSTGPRWFVDTDADGAAEGDLIRSALPSRSMRFLR